MQHGATIDEFEVRETLDFGRAFMGMLILGGTFIVIAESLDFFFRLRMTRVGHKRALFLGGAFNYREYHKVRDKYGWSAWPVYTMWGLTVFGLLFLCIGVFKVFGH
jgi:hypothetical protein